MPDPQKAPNTSPAGKDVPSERRRLLAIYVSLPPKEREKKFAGSERAAEIAGVSQRTIAKWINEGKIDSIFVANRHHVWLDSLLTHLEGHVEDDIAG
ncbi:MAG: helix-turn-helix domain-containing protein [Acidobacteriota bacterium]